MRRPFTQWLEYWSGQFPASPALIDDGQVITYASLMGLVQDKLDEWSALPSTENPIHIVEETDPLELAVLFHAAPRSGRAFMPLDPAMPAKNKEHLYKLAASPKSFAVLPPDPEGVHLIIATSGTTGLPKGVMLSGNNLVASAQASRLHIGLEPEDKWLACLPLFHIGGLSILNRCAEAGACAVLQNRFDVEEALEFIEKYDVTHLSVVPTMLDGFLDVLGSRPAPRSLKRVLVGGAALSEKLAIRALDKRWPLCPTYGMSETTSQCLTMVSINEEWQEGETGAALKGFDVELDNQRLKVRGPGVMAGYLTQSGEYGVGLEEGWFHTNDLTRQNEDGSFCLIGRSDDVVIVGGKNVHPVVIEKTLAQCPDVGDLAITAIEDEKWGQALVIAYCGAALPDAVLEFAATHLSGAYKPRKAQKLAELPRNALGKLDRVKLKGLIG